MTLQGEGCPQQPGRVVGITPSGNEHAEDVMWIVDTGAELATVRDCVGREFGYQLVEGLYATASNGTLAGLVVDGLQAEFTIEDQAGKSRTVRSSRYAAIAPDDAEDDLLGMAQVSDVGATIVWNPRAGRGSLRLGVVAGMIAIARTWLGRMTR